MILKEFLTVFMWTTGVISWLIGVGAVIHILAEAKEMSFIQWILFYLLVSVETSALVYFFMWLKSL